MTAALRGPVGGTLTRLFASVVICTYSEERIDLLRAAVAAAAAQLRPGDELIVVVDHNDGLLDRLRGELTARVVANQEAVGLSGARNTGTTVACGDVVVFLDDDAVPAPGWLNEIVAPLVDEAVAGVGGDVRPSWATGRPRWFPPELDWVVGCSYAGQQRGVVRNPIGANMAFRRSALHMVGGFHHGLGRVGKTPLGCEETDLGLRVQVAGVGSCLVIDEARVDHHVPADRASLRYLTRRCYAEGLSKAEVARRARATVEGAARSAPTLAPERRYLLVLATAMASGVVGAVRHRDPAMLGRTVAIPLGLGCAAIGYARGTLASRRRTSRTARG